MDFKHKFDEISRKLEDLDQRERDLQREVVKLEVTLQALKELVPSPKESRQAKYWLIGFFFSILLAIINIILTLGGS